LRFTVVPLAVLAALVAVSMTGVTGVLDAGQGLDCVATELTCAAAVVLGAWLAIRRGPNKQRAPPAKRQRDLRF